MKIRLEKDSMGTVEVPADKYWGAQTQRSLHHFSIGIDKMPGEVISGFAVVKKASALVNCSLGKLSKVKCELICAVADEIIGRKAQ